MKRITPGREISAMSFIVAALMVIFGIFFLSSIPSGGGLFGIIFILAGIFLVIWHLNKAVGSKRFSLYDITDSKDEVRNKYPFDNDGGFSTSSQKTYCPWCGETLDNSQYVFCPKCGKRM